MRFERASAAPGLPAPETLFNDLLEPALAIAPELKPLMAEIARLVECPVHLTGSGSCLFVLAEDPLHAEAMAASIERDLELPAAAVCSRETSHVE